MRKILVTNALPYANGPIHMGHLLGYIQADIWVRAMRAMGHDVIYVCADDAHGTAIMLRAEANGISPEQQIQQVSAEHQRDFKRFSVEFDHYDSTHSATSKARVEDIYLKNKEKNNIDVRPVTQLYDPEKKMFLSDRFIKGTCPRCKTPDQYGDNCEHCGATYNATELLDPHSTLSGATPIEKSSDHYFFKLPLFSKYLQQWTRTPKRLPVSIANKLDEWFESGLNDWDISRDAPYFGFQIPNAPNKYFYVWLDAPIGYISSFESYIKSKRPELCFDEYWAKDSETELYHFIGKDIVYFHALFWPALLSAAEYRTPSGLFVNGFLTLNGQKMSKSRGTFITAESYSKHLNPEYLRYYFATKLSDKVEDSDLNLDDFLQKVNSDLVGKVVNIASRCAKFINKDFDNQLAETVAEPELIQHFIDAGDSIIRCYEAREFSQAVREIMQLADRANQYIDEKKPWLLAKQAGSEQQVHAVCSVGINLFRQLMLYLSPILPELSAKSQQFLQLESFDFASRHHILQSHAIAQFSPLLTRVDKKQIDAMLNDGAEASAETTKQKPKSEASKTKSTSESKPDVIDINSFNQVDMRVAKILDAELVEGADKLLKLSLDVGEAQARQVFSGIRSQYQPAQLVGKYVVAVVNLAPRKMKFGISNGMVLAAANELGIFLIEPDSGAKPGDKVS